LFENIWIQPAAGDAGGSIGAALAAWYQYSENHRVPEMTDSMKGSYLGPSYTNKDIEKMMTRFNLKAAYYNNFEDMAQKVAVLLNEGKIIGWFQGRMEFGPRALGNRSILGDARNPEMQKKMNLKIKFRESFRPFAPAIIEEDISEYCEYKAISPYMLLVMPVNKKRRNELPVNYEKDDLSTRLYFKRSDVPAITHIDFSARVQTVNKTTNERFYKLLEAFKKLTGYGILINTSFNVRGEPIVCNPEDAVRCFMNTEIDYLAINNYLFAKEELAHLKEQFSKDFKVGTD
jgi:carbamoyltransferase